MASASDEALEKRLVTEALFRVFRNVDTYNWQELPRDFAREIVIDYRNHGVSKVKRFSRSELAQFWKSRHQGRDTSQH